MNQYKKTKLKESYANLFNARLPWNINIYKLEDRCDILVNERILQDYKLIETIPAYTLIKGKQLERLAEVLPKEWQLAPVDYDPKDQSKDSIQKWKVAKCAEAFIKSQALEVMLGLLDTLAEKHFNQDYD
jgi:hypothetical protein